MIIALDDALAGTPAKDPVVEAVSNLLRAHRNREHLVVCTRDLHDWLDGLAPTLGQLDAGTLKRLKRESSEVRALTESGDARINIGPPDTSPRIDPPVVHLPLTCFEKPSSALQTRIIAESLTNDARLYAALARTRRRHVSLYEGGGGGGTTGSELAQAAGEPRIVVGVVDGDRQHPNGPRGPTFERARTALQGLTAWVDGEPPSPGSAAAARLLCLDARTIENLLPRCWLEAHPDTRDQLANVDQSVPHAPDRHIWLDRKGDIPCRDSVGESEKSAYIRACLGQAPRPCASLGTCEARGRDKDRCDTKLLVGFGGAVKRLAALLTGNKADTALIAQGLAESPGLCRIADELAQWGRAPQFWSV